MLYTTSPVYTLMLNVSNVNWLNIAEQNTTRVGPLIPNMYRLLTTVILLVALWHLGDGRSFSIDYEHDTFVMDDQPFRYVSGSAHYFRMPNEYWRDRLRKIRAAGLNVVSTYVEWSQHEKIPGQYDFTGDLDLVKFIQTAAEEDLYVILRPGPYICAERDMGGFPFWLLQKHPDMQLRTNDENYKNYVKIWFDVLLKLVQPYLYGNGGPIIMVQVENEYGSYYACDRDYTAWLRDTTAVYVQDKALLFTTDGSSESFLKCGKIPDVYATVDFGSGSTDMNGSFAGQRKYEPRGPLVNSEYYPGWLTHWGEALAVVDTQRVVLTLDAMLDYGANVNVYMFYGGTNFGFTAGANDPYVSDLTSYDYDAPLSEAGDLTGKYFAMKEVIAKYLPLPTNVTVSTSPKGAYGPVTLKASAGLFQPKIRQLLGEVVKSKLPSTFEALGQNYGYLLYETNVVSQKKQTLDLTISNLHDKAIIYVNDKYVGDQSREFKIYTTSLPLTAGVNKIGILTENLGRLNYGSHINDFKGILSNVTLDNAVLQDWNMTKLELNSLKPIEYCYNDISGDCLANYETSGAIFYMSRFVLNDKPLETFLNVTNLTKGLVFINNFNLGRYWSTRGPTLSLYVPGVYLKPAPEENVIVVLEENLKQSEITLEFLKEPVNNRLFKRMKRFNLDSE